jgi:hypothetical protein
MKPAPSPLNIIDFAILNFELNFVAPATENANGGNDLRSYFNNYDLDVDFYIHSDSILQVFIKAYINRKEERLPGYSIYAEIACLFDYNKDIPVSPEAKSNIEGYSTVYMALNSLRGFISQITANGPVGRYILPSIDLNDLIEQKKASTEKKDSPKDTKGKKSSSPKKKRNNTSS